MTTGGYFLIYSPKDKPSFFADKIRKKYQVRGIKKEEPL